jgi:6-phosphogluconate dehydrogenase
MEPSSDFGIVGLGVMGRNLMLNVTDHGFSAIGLDVDAEKAAALEASASGRPMQATTAAAEFAAALKLPRKIMLMVPAGQAVDSAISTLSPFLSSGDLIIDGGNSHFTDTSRRQAELEAQGLHFLGAGISGGAEGARRGPSIMPGGTPEAYRLAAPILEAIAAKVDGQPCSAHLGNGSAGHYIKMVHNGIEYALMQLIAEAYDILKFCGGLNTRELHQVFKTWSRSALQSYLIAITAQILLRGDDRGEGWLLDKIQDQARQKGTGKWTSQNAMDLGIPTPTTDAAIVMRGLSALKMERKMIAPHYTQAVDNPPTASKALVIAQMGQALHFAFIAAFAQGMHQLTEASQQYGYGLNLEGIARTWRGGCIIRAALLDSIQQAYAEQPALRHLFLSPVFHQPVLHGQQAARAIIKTAIDHGRPALALSAALHYFDACRCERLPLNLVQAQRDFFGAHTFERVDVEGAFHVDW